VHTESMDKLGKEEADLECTQFQIHSSRFCVFPLPAILNLLINIITGTNLSSLNIGHKVKANLSL
jgi:hypothetical protein